MASHRRCKLPTQGDSRHKAAIGYVRVSTPEQGRSGLGLAAQRHDIEVFAAREGLTVRAWFEDVQTGAGKDALLLRPGLAAALKEARAACCPLIVSRLDRLSRNVHFITHLMEHKIHFMVAALGRDCDEFTLHIYASLAEQERKMISERIRGALARSKKPLGMRHPVRRTAAFRRWQRVRIDQGIRKAARARAEGYRVHIEWALSQPDRWGYPISFGGAARLLNAQQLPSPMGGRWSGGTVRDLARRLGFADRVAWVPRNALQARVNACLRQHPQCTGRELIAHLGLQHSVGIARAWAVLQRARESVARSHWAHRRLKWPISHLTATRLRISDIWKQHPRWTARQVSEALGPKHPVRVEWVRDRLRECRRAFPERRRLQRIPRHRPMGA
jgi:DNA invertase Pin-like site-specific DNA recombinase